MNGTIKTCPFCRYERTEDDHNPAWECPSCKRAYTKFWCPDSTKPNQVAQKQPIEKINGSDLLKLMMLATVLIIAWAGVSDRCGTDDLMCVADEYRTQATAACKPLIELRAKYSARWTDSWAESPFSRVQWKNKAARTIGYIGNAVQFQNGFGAWQTITYECAYNTSTGQVLAVQVN
ncbi:MAG: hypothetical protein L0H73_04375 [Nitrococcus sp.]|nr:hypothetical protein [Nitrococcus sp.]